MHRKVLLEVASVHGKNLLYESKAWIYLVFSGGSNNTGGSTPASSSTPEPPANTTSTTGNGPACVEEEIPQKLRVYEKIKKVETWEECRDACNADTSCAFFRWKVS